MQSNIEKIHENMWNQKRMQRLIKLSSKIFVYALTGKEDGRYIQVVKKDLIAEIENNSDSWDVEKFKIKNSYDFANESNNWQPKQELWIN